MTTILIILIIITIGSSIHFYYKGLKRGYDDGWKDAGGDNIPEEEKNY